MNTTKVGAVEILNTTPHTITFQGPDGEPVAVPPCGVLLNAQAVQTPAGERYGVTLVKTAFAGTPEGAALLDAVPEGVLVVGSVIAAQAYPGRCFGLIAAPGFERVPTEQKRMDPRRFMTFE